MIVLAVISTIYLLLIGFYNSYLLDDYIFLNNVRESGVWGFIKNMYLTWQGRYGGFLLSALNYALFPYGTNMVWMTLIHLILGYGTVGFLITLLDIKLNKYFRVLLSVLIVNLIVLGQIAFSTFYWGCTVWYVSVNYLTIWLFVLIFSNRVNNIVTYCLIILFSVIIGGFAETYTPLIILIIVSVLLLNLRINGLLNKEKRIKLILSLSILCLGFFVLLIAPGNKIRVEKSIGVLPDLNVDFFIKTITLYVDFLFFVLSKIIYTFLLFPIFIFIGYFFKSESIFFEKLRKLEMRHFLFSVLGLVIFFYIAILPGIYAMNNELPPMRSLAFIPFVLAVFFSFWGLSIGSKIKSNFFIQVLLSFSIVLIIFIVSVKIYKDIPDVMAYKQAITNLHQNLIERNKLNNTAPIIVTPINIPRNFSTFSVIYNNSVAKLGVKSPKNYYDFCYLRYYLSPNANDWRNQSVKNFFGLKNDIIGWDREFLLYIE